MNSNHSQTDRTSDLGRRSIGGVIRRSIVYTSNFFELRSLNYLVHTRAHIKLQSFNKENIGNMSEAVCIVTMFMIDFILKSIFAILSSVNLIAI